MEGHGLAVGPQVPAEVTNLVQLAAWAKANPGKANCGNPGEGGSFPHFLTLVLAKALGAPIQPVPYRGGAPALNDLLAGQLAALLLPDGSFLPYGKDKVRVLATSGETRSPFYPDVATFAEQGVKEIVVWEWFGLFAPAGTPAPVVNRIADAIARVIANPEITPVFAKFGMVPKANRPADLAALIKSDAATWGPVIKATGFKPLE